MKMVKSNRVARHVDGKGDEERIDEEQEGERDQRGDPNWDGNQRDGDHDERRENKSKYKDSYSEFVYDHDDDARENENGLKEGRHATKEDGPAKSICSSRKSGRPGSIVSWQSVRGSLSLLHSLENITLQVAISAHFGVREALGRVRIGANDPSKTVHTNGIGLSHVRHDHHDVVPHKARDFAWVFLDGDCTMQEKVYLHDPKCTPCTPLSHVKNRWYDREQRGEYACVVRIYRNSGAADARILPEPDQQSAGQDRASDGVNRTDDEINSTDDATSGLYSIKQQIRIHLVVASYLVAAFVISSAIPGWGHPKSTHVSRILLLVWLNFTVIFHGFITFSGWDRENLFRRKIIWFCVYKFIVTNLVTVVYFYAVFIPKSNDKSRGNCPIDIGMKGDIRDCQPRHPYHREGHPLSEDTSDMLSMNAILSSFFYGYFRMARFHLFQDNDIGDDHDATQVDRDHPNEALQAHDYSNLNRISKCWRDPYGLSCVTLIVNQFYLNITKFRSIVTHGIWIVVIAIGVLAPSYISRFDVMTLSTHPSAIVQLMRGFLLVASKQVVAVLVYIAASKLHIPGIRLYLQVQLAAVFSVIVPLMVSQSSSFLNVIALLFVDSLTVFTRVFFATPLFDSSHLTSERRVSKFLSALVFCARRWSLYYRIRPPIATPIFPFFMVGLQSENQVASVGFTVVLLLYPCSYLLHTLAPERSVPSESQMEYYHDQDRHLALLYEFVFPHGFVSFLYVLLGFGVEVLQDYFVRRFYHISFEKKYDCRVIKDVEEYYISDPQKTKGKLDSHSKLTLFIWFTFTPFIISLSSNTASLAQLRKQGVFAP